MDAASKNNELTEALQKVENALRDVDHELEAEGERVLLGTMTLGGGLRQDVYAEPDVSKIIDLQLKQIDLQTEKIKLELNLLQPHEFLQDFAEQKLCERRLRDTGYRLLTASGVGSNFTSLWLSHTKQKVGFKNLEDMSDYVRNVVAQARPIARITYHSTQETQVFYSGEENQAVAELEKTFDEEGVQSASYEVIPGIGADQLEYRFHSMVAGQFGEDPSMSLGEFMQSRKAQREADYQGALDAGIPPEYARLILTQEAKLEADKEALTILPEPMDQVLIYLHEVPVFGVSLRVDTDAQVRFGEPEYGEPQFFDDPIEALQAVNANRILRGQNPIELNFGQEQEQNKVNASLQGMIAAARVKAAEQSKQSAAQKDKHREEER